MGLENECGLAAFKILNAALNWLNLQHTLKRWSQC